jgi:hypothetical protein
MGAVNISFFHAYSYLVASGPLESSGFSSVYVFDGETGAVVREMSVTGTAVVACGDLQARLYLFPGRNNLRTTSYISICSLAAQRK